jgi:fructose 5-dehydrogenase small subunit
MRAGIAKTATQRGMTRRQLLQGLAALAASGWLPKSLAQNAQAALTQSQFAALCNAYTGYAFTDPKVANAMLRALTSAVGATDLSRVARLAASTPATQLDVALAVAGLQHAAERVVVALYSGTVDTPKGTIVISYDQALVWQACGWTKPNAFCGGVTNYWASAPAGYPS